MYVFYVAKAFCYCTGFVENLKILRIKYKTCIHMYRKIPQNCVGVILSLYLYGKKQKKNRQQQKFSVWDENIMLYTYILPCCAVGKRQKTKEKHRNDFSFSSIAFCAAVHKWIHRKNGSKEEKMENSGWKKIQK